MKFLACDPGEDFGWSVWKDDELLGGSTTKMWDFSDVLWRVALRYMGFNTPELPDDLEEHVATLELTGGKYDCIDTIVTENWTLYPWVVQSGGLDWDECRTARVIGSIYAVCRLTGWEYVQQPAKIKERAIAAGAEAHFFHPLRENRHQNDAIMHGVYYLAKRAGAAWTDLSTTKINA